MKNLSMFSIQKIVLTSTIILHISRAFAFISYKGP